VQPEPSEIRRGERATRSKDEKRNKRDEQKEVIYVTVLFSFMLFKALKGLPPIY
jgi:hypothetical protein